MPHKLRSMVRSFAAFGLTLALVLPAAGADKSDGNLVLDNPFLALSNGVADATHDTPEKMAAMLAELDYDGISPSGVDGVPAMTEAMEARDLKEKLRLARPHLFILQINGADTTGGFRPPSTSSGSV